MVQQHDALPALEQCFEHLAQRSRDVLRMRYQMAVAREEIADRCGLSLGGVKSILERGKRELRRCIEGRLA